MIITQTHRLSYKVTLFVCVCKNLSGSAQQSWEDIVTNTMLGLRELTRLCSQHTWTMYPNFLRSGCAMGDWLAASVRTMHPMLLVLPSLGALFMIGCCCHVTNIPNCITGPGCITRDGFPCPWLAMFEWEILELSFNNHKRSNQIQITDHQGEDHPPPPPKLQITREDPPPQFFNIPSLPHPVCIEWCNQKRWSRKLAISGFSLLPFLRSHFSFILLVFDKRSQSQCPNFNHISQWHKHQSWKICYTNIHTCDCCM